MKFLAGLLTLLIVPLTHAEQITLPIGDSSIQFPVDGGYVPVCHKIPGVMTKVSELMPHARVVECFFTADDMRRMKQGIRPDGEVFFLVSVPRERDGRPINRRDWIAMKSELLREMPPSARNVDDSKVGIVEESPDVVGKQFSEGSAEHVYRETPLSISIEEEDTERKVNGRKHVTLLADLVANNHLIAILAVHGYTSETAESALKMVRKQLDAVVDKTVALNLSEGFALNSLEPTRAFAADRSDAMNVCRNMTGDTTARIAACSAAIVAGRLSDTGISDAYKYRADGYAHLKNYRAALADLDALVERQPDNAGAFADRGIVHHDLGDYSSATADLERSIRLNGGSLWAFGHLGQAYEANRDFERAEASYSHAIEMDRADLRGWVSRCFARGVIGKNLDAALADCSEAMKQSPPDQNSLAHVLSYRCFVQYRMKHYSDAIQDCDIAITNGATFASVFYLRGLAKRAVGDASASDDIGHAKKIDPKIAEAYAIYGAPERP